ncbi:hypothetical protein [Falsiroseomonas oryzae]|uniref:hypothetical protein n=1 Tax=Falsiroseomonas oryzae TaxID=2766473 RepID=UPI0022EA2E79|nr:hypothetical protein [Roseomonas sp. MO-31]
MTPTPLGAAAPPAPADLIAASLLTSDEGAELHLIARDGSRLRLAADEATARALALNLWQALEQPR